MRKKIVFQLFSLTFLLCCVLIAIIFAGQFYITKYLYVDKEKEFIQNQLKAYYKFYADHSNDEKSLQNIESSYFQKYGIMIARLDELANIKELPSGNFFLEVVDKNDATKTNKILLNNWINVRKDTNSQLTEILQEIQEKAIKEISIVGFSNNIKMDKIAPIAVRADIPKYGDIVSEFEYFKYHDLSSEPISKSGGFVITKIPYGLMKRYHVPIYTKLQDTSNNSVNNSQNIQPLYNNVMFAERILDFQADILVQKIKFNKEHWVQNDLIVNDIQYVGFIKPILKNGQVQEIIYTLTPLQPINRVNNLMRKYYSYIIIIIFMFTIMICIYYSKKITKPLLEINDVTKKIMRFEFGEKLTITSKNEIGELSNNINQLSKRMENYIEKLKEEIEKEKKLEQIRKDFIAGVSHELKTPLSVMQISVSILQDGIFPERNEYYLTALEREITKMNILIEEMLNLAKYTSGTYQIQMKKVNIGDLLIKIHDVFQFQIEEKALNIVLNIEKVVAKGQENLLEQVLSNLFTNAIYYTNNGESIIIEVKKLKNEVYVGIENTGIHLSSEDLEKVWDQFYRADKSRKRIKGRTGLGLTIVKNILELHGSNYGVRNTKNGVLFYFHLGSD